MSPAKSTKKAAKCVRCGKPSKVLGVVSGTCPRCQNFLVSELETQLGLKRGELGRVDAKGEGGDL